MYKVLIVDDEPTVREGLKTLIPWEQYGYQVVGTANDGLHALEQYEQLQPDLIISDIQMTEMDGLDFIQKLRAAKEEVQCLILSGYADFHYAKKAMAIHVAGYMLKPIDEDELIQHLETIKTNLDEEAERKQIEIKNGKRNREEFLLSLLLQRNTENLEQNLVRYQLNWKKFQVICIKLEKDMASHCMNKLKRELGAVTWSVEGTVLSHDGFIVIIDRRPPPYQEVEKVFEAYHLDFTASVGSMIYHPKDISQSYQEAIQLIERKFFFERGNYLRKGSGVMEPTDSQDYTNFAMIDKLFYALDMGGNEQLETYLKSLVLTRNKHVYSENEVKMRVTHVLTCLLTKLTKAYPEKQDYFLKTSEYILDLYKQRTVTALLSFVKTILTDIMTEIADDHQEHQLKKLKDFIDKRYGENLKLETLAELFNYNRAYLGKLFKGYTGESFNTYLDKIRISEAKKLLVKGLKVYEVAEKVGYNNVDYFHSKFKKYVGCSPSNYRRQQLKKPC
ncbi:response regulator transcription factor [Halalkalibacter urbisdiaboli]|uniref:response regulator transcription factor n=1 Tax=Halalkalibacter urbisdiaboli TaxID=1960589 RepID=UPI0013FE4136|nr:response regulator transcription factor [Halalkalibacter urbisdiaboli]